MTFINVKPQRRNRKPLFASPNFDYLFQDLMNTDMHKLLKGAKSFNQPAVNILESKDDFQIELAVPGLTKKDIDIQVDKNILTIAAKKEVKKTEGEKLIKREFNYDEFSRNFKLPKTVDTQAIKASFQNGILKIVLSKKEEAKELPAKKIEIS